MSLDFENKEPVAPEKREETSSSEPIAPEAHAESRRAFLTSLGKWSGAVIGMALLGAAAGPAHADDEVDAESEAEGKPESSWRCWRCWRCRCWRCRRRRCRCRCVW